MFGPVKVMVPVSAVCFIILDFFSESSSLWLVKKVLVVFMRLWRPFSFLLIRQMSSAKKRDAMLIGPMSIPRPDLFSSVPRLLINRLNNNGERLQPRMSGLVWRRMG